MESKSSAFGQTPETAMQTQINFYVSLIYLLAAVPYAWLGLFAWRKRPAVAVTSFGWTMVGLSIWSFTYSLELFLPSLSRILFLTKIEYLGIVSIPVFLLFFALEYIGKSHLLTLQTRLLIWAVPLLTLFLVWTNDYHHLMWDRESISEINGLRLLVVHYGVFFWIHTIYSYVLTIFASMLLIVEMVQRPGIYRVQISFVIVGILTPVIGSLIYTVSFNSIPNLTITPLLFLPAALGLAWAIVRYGLLEILPLEYLTVLKNMKDGIIVVNLNKRILYINPLIEKLTGRLEADVIGQPLNRISKEYGEILASQLTGSEHQAEIMFGTGDQVRAFEVTVSPVSSLSAAQNLLGLDSMITLHDITERKKSEDALSRRETMMSAISLAAEQFLKESAWEHNIPGILQKIGQAANVSRVYVFMNYSDEKGVIYTSQCYEWAAPGVVSQINNLNLQHVNLREAGFARWEKQLSKRNSIYGILREFPESEQNALRDQNILSMAVMPIFVENQWWGFIGFDECTYDRHWTETELEALHVTASIFGSAETRARTEQRLFRRQQALSLLQDIVSKALQAKTLRQMTEGIVDQLAKLIHASECFITLWDKDNTQTSSLATYGTSGDTYLSLQPVSGEYTFTELALRLGHTLIVDDAHTSHYLDREIAKHCPSRSLIVLPLIAAEGKFGALILSFKEYHRFQSDEVSICEQAANLIALAFEKFKAVEQAQRRAATSETLRRAGAAITETLETDETVDRILEQLKQVVAYDTASIQIFDGNELEIIGGSGFADLNAVIGMRFSVPGNNPNTIVMETGKPYLLPEIGDVYGEFKKTPHKHIHSWLGIPLIFQERTIGLLAIDSATPNQFTQENITLAMVFADQVSVALENSRIYEKAQNQAITDPLTSVYNRRGLFKLAKIDFAESISSGRPFSGIMIDLDHFKHINDTYGHSAGDLVLREVAKRCKSCIRGLDYVGRYGGEEFLVILPETNIDTALVVAERLRMVIAGNPINWGKDFELNITASLGVAQRDEENTTNLDMLIARADQAMYVAKHKGRNRVAISR
jgi:diguanylate cyclase (GGDEF)-like protein/PAS domain S-box-containing protein